MDTSCGPGDKEAANQEHDSQDIRDPDTFALLRIHYLNMLEHLINLKATYQRDPVREEWLLNAINKAAYSTFHSCIEYGAEEEAKGLVETGRPAD